MRSGLHPGMTELFTNAIFGWGNLLHIDPIAAAFFFFKIAFHQQGE